MTPHAWFKRLWLGGLFAAAVSIAPQVASASASDAPPGPINNTATATYQDSQGNAYSTTSNTATTYVQNAPGILVTANTGQNVGGGEAKIPDTFSIQNTGNGAATISFPTSGGSATSVTTGAIGTGPASSGTCGSGASQYGVTIAGVTTYCDNVTDLNTFLATQSIAAGNTVTLVVYYQSTLGAAAGTSAGASITPSMNQAAQTGVAAATATPGSASTVTDTIVAPRVDTYKTAALAGSNIVYTIYAHNGGNGDAQDLKSAGALLGGGSNGVMIADEIPIVGGSPLSIANSGQVTVATNAAYGFPTGATVELWYTTTAGGASGWTKAAGSLPTFTGVPVNARYLALFVHGGTCGGGSADLCSDTGHATNPGNANVATTPAVSFTFQVVQPAGGLTATNIANSLSGDLAGNIVGPGIAAGTADSASGALISGASTGINNTTLTSTATGASNQTSTTISALDAPQNGPLGNAAATGSYDYINASNPGVSNDTNHDFTAMGFAISGDKPVNSNATYTSNDLGFGAGAPASTQTTSAGTTLCIGHTLLNNGNRADVYTLTANATGGSNPIKQYAALANTGGTTVAGAWTVGFYSDNACTAAYGGASQGATSTATTGSISVSSSVTYYVKYVIPAGVTYFDRFDSLVRATSGNSPSTTDDTHDELYAGFVAMAKKIASVTHAGTPGCSATGNTQVCPGDTINYKLEYASIVIGTTTAGFQAVSFGGAQTKAGTFQITDDGTTGGNTWAANTNGLTASIVDTNSAGSARASTTVTYSIPGPAAAGAGKFAATIGGASFQLTPYTVAAGANNDSGGYITFSVVVK